MDLSEFQTDPTAEKEGVWCALRDAEFLIASTNSPAYKKALEKAGRNEGAAFRRMKTDAVDRAIIDAMVQTVLLDWRGNVALHGTPLTFSEENARTLLKLEAFRQWVATQATDIENFQKEQEETATGALKSGDALAPSV